MMLITMHRGPARLAAVVMLLGLSVAPGRAQTPQTQTVETDPIRCWWRTSAGAVRTGETFSLVLTCAMLENEAVQVVPDESRLGPSVIQMAPFETVGGGHPEDLRTPDRRFFQYEYRLRILNPDYIGRDVPLPDLLLHYRVNSRLAGNAAIEGRDQSYLLPHQAIRIVAMVPADATDIRDTTDESFGTVEGLRFRARALEITAITLMVLGALMVALLLVRIAARKTMGVRLFNVAEGEHVVSVASVPEENGEGGEGDVAEDGGSSGEAGDASEEQQDGAASGGDSA